MGKRGGDAGSTSKSVRGVTTKAVKGDSGRLGNPYPPASDEHKIVDAYNRILGSRSGTLPYVSVADLRDATPSLSRGEFDRAALRMSRGDSIWGGGQPEMNQKALTARDRAAEFVKGGAPVHFMYSRAADERHRLR